MRIALAYPHMNFAPPAAQVCDALAIVNYEIARRLAQEHDVTVFIKRLTDQPRQQSHEGVTWHRIPVRFDRAMCSLKALDNLGLTPADRPYHLSALYYANYARAVANEVRAHQCQIAHVHTVTQLLTAIRRRNPEVPLVFHAHDHSLVDFNAKALQPRLEQAALILACSEHLTRKIQDRFPALADRCRTLHNGVDQRFLKVRADPARSQAVLFVGRLSPEKGVHVLLEAFQHRSKDYPDASLRLVGPRSFAPQQFVDPFGRDPKTAAIRPFFRAPQSYMNAVTRITTALGSRVSCEDLVPNGTITQQYAKAGVFVFPSIWDEPFGIPIIEAMAAGLPVITTRGGAASEIVEDGETGLLVERGDPRGLADALDTLLGNPELRARMGAAGRDRVARLFTWDRAVARLAGHYEKLVAACARSAAAPQASPPSDLQLASRRENVP
jgi:glycosyltransferase involved in cell wall biosynthesis